MNQGIRAECLVVDDEPAIRRTISLVLQDFGFSVREAGDAETALAAIASERPDAIVADVRLPGMNGVELVRRVREGDGRRDLPIVLISAYEEPREHDADRFVSKPFDIEELAQIVAEMVERNGS